jgi:hypothetical protein
LNKKVQRPPVQPTARRGGGRLSIWPKSLITVVQAHPGIKLDPVQKITLADKQKEDGKGW